jgi:glycosyltransferase involved in cell wall biosynthesis
VTDPLLTVVLCAHNPSGSAISRVLASLARQTLPSSSWELLLVDNMSAPPLSERGLPLPSNTRFVVETELGLTPARLAGFAAAKGALIVLIDDDTVVEHDYLEIGLKLMTDHPEVGAAGGRVRGEFAAPPGRWVLGHLDLLAIRDFGDRPIRALVYNEVGPWEPCGAGMVVRRQVAQAYAERTRDPSRRRLDRTGKGLSSCGDTDLARTAPELGLYLAYEPRLALTHLIPASRLRARYLARLAYCVQRDGWFLYRLRGKPCQLSGWRLYVHLVLAPVLSMSPDPRRWLLNAASAYGRLRGRSIDIEAAKHG